MFFVLFALGLLVMAAGFLTIGFGIPINAFSLGNTLIISGTVAVVGGLVLIGLAAAIRQLSRIAIALNTRPMARPSAAPVADDVVHAPAPAVDSHVPPTARMPQVARAPAPPKPPEPVMPPQVEPRSAPEPRPAPEPRLPATAGEPGGPPLDWLRAKPKPKMTEAPPLAAEPPEVADEVPLSPRAPQRPAFSPPSFASGPATEPPPPPEPRSWMPPRGNMAEPAPMTDTVPRHDIAPRSPQADRGRDETGQPGGKDAGLFDVVWPDARAKSAAPAEPVKRESRPAPRFDPKFEPPRRDDSRLRDEPRMDKRPEPAAERPAVLKSGVIDGMAYTLYADGSIEAELPQGTVTFASVDALRAHLEKSA